MIDPKDTRMDEGLDDGRTVGVSCYSCNSSYDIYFPAGSKPDFEMVHERAGKSGWVLGTDSSGQAHYSCKHCSPGLFNALPLRSLHPSIGDSEAGAETSLRNVQRSGWTLVPVEPTEAMTLAGIEARQKRPPNTIYGHTADFGIEQGARDRWYADEAYRAMLSAAPKVSP